jgi:hypothetical protein
LVFTYRLKPAIFFASNVDLTLQNLAALMLSNNTALSPAELEKRVLEPLFLESDLTEKEKVRIQSVFPLDISSKQAR